MNTKTVGVLSFAAGAIAGGVGVYIWARKWIEERVNKEMEQFRDDMKDGFDKAKKREPKEEVKESTDVKEKVEDGSLVGKKIYRTQTERDYASYFSGPSPTEIAAAARKSFNEHMADRESPQEDDEDEEDFDPDSVDEETDDEREIREEGYADIDGGEYADYDPLKDIIKKTGDHTYLISEGSYGEVYAPQELIWTMIDGRLIDCVDHSYYGDPYRIIGELPDGKFEDGDVIYIRNTALCFDYEITFRYLDLDGYLDSLNP